MRYFRAFELIWLHGHRMYIVWREKEPQRYHAKKCQIVLIIAVVDLYYQFNTKETRKRQDGSVLANMFLNNHYWYLKWLVASSGDQCRGLWLEALFNLNVGLVPS